MSDRKNCLIQLANKSSLLHPRRCLSFHRFMFSIQNNFCKKKGGGGGGGNGVIGVQHGIKFKCQLLRRNFFLFSSTPTGVLYGMKLKCHLMRQIIISVTLCVVEFFSFMQEITLYFLRQNKLRFILTWHCKPIKSQVHNRPWVSPPQRPLWATDLIKTVNTCSDS